MQRCLVSVLLVALGGALTTSCGKQASFTGGAVTIKSAKNEAAAESVPQPTPTSTVSPQHTIQTPTLPRTTTPKSVVFKPPTAPESVIASPPTAPESVIASPPTAPESVPAIPTVPPRVETGCQGSQRVALLTALKLAAAGSSFGTLNVTPMLIATAKNNPTFLENFDTIVVEMTSDIVLPVLPSPLSGVTEPAVLPAYLQTRLDAGAKIILLWNDKFTNFNFFQLKITSAHHHPSTLANLQHVTYVKKGQSLIVAAFDPVDVGPLHLLQMYPEPRPGTYENGRFVPSSAPLSSNSLCGTISYDDYAVGGNKGPFHGFLRDTATRKGVLFLVGLSYIRSDRVVGTLVNLSDRFMQAHFQQPWESSGELSSKCNLTCDETDPGMVPGVGKPVIYLYPQKEQRVQVQVEIKNGHFVTTFPKYDEQKKGWDVIASPDGTLKNVADNQEYSYIYWTGTSAALKPDLSEGFLVKGEDTAQFLRKTLKQLGMNAKEYNEMIVYWLPYMERHKYNLIKFLGKEYTDIASMKISPKPDSTLRVFMVFKEVSADTKVKEQKLPATFKRNGFSVVEWGGSELDGEWSVFH